jgi:thymidylate synthase (FAD)
MVLPLATTTNLALTANARALQNFFALRLDKAAQWEIRELAEKIQEIVRGYCPSAF